MSDLPAPIPKTQLAIVPTTVGVKDLLDAFLSGKSPRTIDAYRQDLEDFSRHVGAESIEGASQALLAAGQGPANLLVLKYRTHLMESGKSPNTINRRLASIRSVVKLARSLGMVPWALDVPSVRREAYRDTRGPGETGMKRLLDAAKETKNPHKLLRDVAIIRLLHDLALRRGEVVALDLDDLDLSQGTLLVKGKGRTEKQLLSLPIPTSKALLAWVNARGDWRGPLFTNFDSSEKGKSARLTGRSVHRLIRKLGEEVGLRVRPHGLRHTAITEAVKQAQANGMGIEEVMDFSRHRSVSTLMIYRDRERNVQGSIASIVAGELE